MRKFIILFIGLFCVTSMLNAQDLLNGKDISKLKADMISASDLAKLKSQINSAGMSLDQAEQMAISKGMPASEAAKLKLRLSSNTTNSSENKNNNVESTSKPRENSNPEQLDSPKDKEGKPATLINPLIFGSELYSSASMSFEPNLKLATPVNYILGPEDQIQVTVYGVQEYNGNLSISPEGSVSIPNVGEVKLAGMTIEAATQKLKNIMGNSVYSYLKSGEAKLSVSLSKIRSISVTIIGSNRPGNFKLSSLASVFNALFIAGGPSAFGSFREIELIRNNKLEKKIDLYRFLFEGSQIDNIGLKDNDVIRIPAYKTRVELKGEVKRPGIFEVLPGESFSKILMYASGFTDEAYMESVKIFQRNEKDRQIQDLKSLNFGTYQPKSGDVVEISKILDRFKNRVIISGAVFRPSQYELSTNLTVADLIKKADGLKSDAFTDRGQIIRLKEDLSKTIISFDVKKALSGDIENNILLQREDFVTISSIDELKEKFKITIQGEVRNPGKFDFIEKLTLKDLILQAGGFTDASNKKVEIARLIKRDSIAVTDNQSSVIFKVEINGKDLSVSDTSNFLLNPFDVVTVRKVAGYIIPESILINGQVQYPGPYTLGNNVERVSDILKRSGGFTPDANPQGAYLKRYKTGIEKETSIDAVNKLNKVVSDKDSSQNVGDELLRDFDKIPLNLSKILKSPGELDDIVLKSNDEIFIPKFDGLVKISGEVLLSTQVPFQTDRKFSDYINSAGGFTSMALKNKAYIVYANGMASSTKRFLFFKSYPKVLPGSEIVIPKEREKKGASTAEIIGLASALASLAGVTIAILKL